MNRATHIIIGFSAGLLVGGSSLYSLLYGVSGALGAYIPDIKHPPYRRRKSTHNIVIPVLLLVITYSTYMLISTNTHNPIVLFTAEISTKSLYAISIGWLTHVFTDSLSAGGVYPLWPFSEKVIRLTRLRSNSLALNLFGLLIAFTLLYLWLIMSGLNDVVEEFIKNLLRSLS